MGLGSNSEEVGNILYFSGNPILPPLENTYVRGASIDEYGVRVMQLEYFPVSVEEDADKLAAGLLDDVAYPEPCGFVQFYQGDASVRVGDIVELRDDPLRRLERSVEGEWGGRFSGKLVGRVRRVMESPTRRCTPPRAPRSTGSGAAMAAVFGGEGPREPRRPRPLNEQIIACRRMRPQTDGLALPWLAARPPPGTTTHRKGDTRMDTSKNGRGRLRLTAKMIETLPGPPDGSPSKQAEYADLEVIGLRAVVTATGRRYLDFRFRFAGRKRLIRIGEYPSVSLKEARERAHQYKNAIWNGVDPMVERRNRTAASLTLADFAAEYLEHAKANKRTWRNDEQKLRRELIPAWGRLPLSAVTTRDVQAMHNRLSTQGSPATANRHLALVHRIFAVAAEWGHLPREHRNPAQGVRKFRENNARDRYLTGDEIERFLAALDARPEKVTAGAIKLLLFTGMRRGEGISLRWENVDLERGTLFLPVTKSGRSRTVVLNALARGVIEEMAALRRKGHPYVFPGKNPGEHLAEPRKTFERVRDELGLGDLHLHDLRHTFASVAVQNGASLYEVQKLLGHQSSQMTQRYAHLGDASLRAVTDGVAEQMSRPRE